MQRNVKDLMLGALALACSTAITYPALAVTITNSPKAWARWVCSAGAESGRTLLSQPNEY